MYVAMGMIVHATVKMAVCVAMEIIVFMYFLRGYWYACGILCCTGCVW